MSNVGLVLEGGGMRGIYTCGVLEFFLDKKLYFKYVIGVSAGASNSASYISRQKGRGERVNLNYLNDWRYMSLRSLLIRKSYFGMKFIFDEIPNKYDKFDFETFNNNECQYWVGTTDCNTGKPVYFNKEQVGKNFNILKASCSLPFLSPMIKCDEYELLDGGISDSIPIKKSISDGNDKNVIVLTRDKGYRKVPMKNTKLLEMKYKKYPKLIEAILNRYKKYNETLDYIEKLENEGKALVIRPVNEVKVDRLERNREKLHNLYLEGYKNAESVYNELIAYNI